MDVFIYLRKSRKDIEEENKAAQTGEKYDTLQRHRNTLLSVARKHNYNILDIYNEVVSGESITARNEMQRMLRDMENTFVDGVLVIDIDRLGRGDLLDQGILDRAFRYTSTKIITPSQIYDPDSEDWELVFGVKSIVARQELKAITRRLQAGRKDSAKEGKAIAKKPPYGYLRDDNLKLYPDPDTAWVVKKIFQMMKDGQGRQYIAQELDKLGIVPPNPKREFWSPSTITAIVKNEVYKGDIIWGKTSYTKRGDNYLRKKTSSDKWIVSENAHEPLVSKELFNAANKAHTGRHRPSTEIGKTLSNPLAGILKCKICGYTMLNIPRKDRPNNMMRCATPTCKGVQKGAISALVEQRVIEGLEELVEQFETFVDPTPVSEENTELKERAIEKKRKELHDLTTQKNNLHDLLERGVYDIDTFMERQQNINERSKEIEEGIQNLQREIDYEKQKNQNLNEFVPSVKKVLEAYHHTDSAEKKNRLLKSILEKATYLRKQDWKKRDQFVIQLYPKI